MRRDLILLALLLAAALYMQATELRPVAKPLPRDINIIEYESYPGQASWDGREWILEP